ncbi:MAG: helix-turn-helix transcriptional regulator [Alphaproteobacteria bacterium]|nr:helix-turn-helix transcriptional regulator [Alphaproteobacteria bacterium]
MSTHVNSPYMINTLFTLGENIKKYRLALDLSQEELADKCGFDRTYISMLERGKRNPSLINLIRLAEGLGINIAKLTHGCENGFKPRK